MKILYDSDPSSPFAYRIADNGRGFLLSQDGYAMEISRAKAKALLLALGEAMAADERIAARRGGKTNAALRSMGIEPIAEPIDATTCGHCGITGGVHNAGCESRPPTGWSFDANGTEVGR